MAIAIILAVLAVVLLFWWLNKYTDHGGAYTVPDLSGLQMSEVKDICVEKGFKYLVIDSVYNDDTEPGAVVEQNPDPGYKVKKGHTIYLKTNALGIELVSMPELTGISLRQAQAVLETYGLVGGNLRYVPDIAENVVIRQMVNGDEIDVGTKIPKGTSIDLILGLGLSNEKTYVPNLVGLSYKQAGNRLLDEYLNLGAIIFDETVENKADSIEARVFRQIPRYDTINEINLGSNVDVWLSTDTSLWKPLLRNNNEEPE